MKYIRFAHDTQSKASKQRSIEREARLCETLTNLSRLDIDGTALDNGEASAVSHILNSICAAELKVHVQTPRYRFFASVHETEDSRGIDCWDQTRKRVQSAVNLIDELSQRAGWEVNVHVNGNVFSALKFSEPIKATMRFHAEWERSQSTFWTPFAGVMNQIRSKGSAGSYDFIDSKHLVHFGKVPIVDHEADAFIRRCLFDDSYKTNRITHEAVLSRIEGEPLLDTTTRVDFSKSGILDDYSDPDW